MDLLRPAPRDGDKAFCPVPRIVRKPLDNLTRLISDLSLGSFADGCGYVRYKEEHVRSVDRAVGTFLAGAMTREKDTTGGGAADILGAGQRALRL